MAAWMHRGFTLIELMVAMTILILLLVLAMPATVPWMSDSEIAMPRSQPPAALDMRRRRRSRVTATRFVLAQPAGTWRWSTHRWFLSRRPRSTKAQKRDRRGQGYRYATPPWRSALGQTTTDPTNLAQVDFFALRGENDTDACL